MVRCELTTEIDAPVQRCFDLARSIEVHLLGTQNTGEQAVEGVTTGLIGPNQYVRWRAKHLGVRQSLTSKITAFASPSHFQDTMVAGAFQSLQHDHFFEALPGGGTRMRDVLLFAAPVPLIGLVVEKLFLERYMTRFLQSRNAVLKQVAESDRWSEFLPASLAAEPRQSAQQPALNTRSL